MIKAIQKEIHTLSAAIDPKWNWRNFRPRVNPVLPTDVLLPDTIRDFMANVGEVVGGTHMIYGGALNDLAMGKTPRDLDGYVLTPLHPIFAVNRLDRWARKSGYTVVHYRRRVKLLWKRLKIVTPHGEYDLGLLKNLKTPQEFIYQMADEADVSPCARAASVTMAYESQRCREGEANNQLIFRQSLLHRDRFRHLDRWLKYAIVKYPQRDVVYQCPDDAALFTDLNARRSEISARHTELAAQGETPKGFAPFRPLMPEFYDTLHERAKAQLT